MNYHEKAGKIYVSVFKKVVSDLSKEELLICLVESFEEIESLKEQFFKSQETNATFMNDMIKLKFQNDHNKTNAFAK